MRKGSIVSCNSDSTESRSVSQDNQHSVRHKVMFFSTDYVRDNITANVKKNINKLMNQGQDGENDDENESDEDNDSEVYPVQKVGWRVILQLQMETLQSHLIHLSPYPSTCYFI